MRAVLVLVATIALALLACKPAPRMRVDAGSESNPSADACLDRWLAEQKLDAYGSPLGTVYAGGTPAFDETSGTARSRWDYLVEKYPALARTCDGAHGSSR
jgi:hypothetical protein